MNNINAVIHKAFGGSGVSAVDLCDTSKLEQLLLDEQGRLRPVPADDLKQFSHQELQVFAHKHAVYSIPTFELLEFLKRLIPNMDKCIEIGAGNGVYGRALGVPMYDNYMQHPKNRRKFGEAALMYALAGQPVVEYGEDVQEMDGMDAVVKHKPETILMSWVTHKYKRSEHFRGGNMFGIDMLKMARRNGVKRIILIGNENVHQKSPLMDLPLQSYEMPEVLFSRASAPELDRIYVWNLEN